MVEELQFLSQLAWEIEAGALDLRNYRQVTIAQRLLAIAKLLMQLERERDFLMAERDRARMECAETAAKLRACLAARMNAPEPDAAAVRAALEGIVNFASVERRPASSVVVLPVSKLLRGREALNLKKFKIDD